MESSLIVINGITFYQHTWPLLGIFCLVLGTSIVSLAFLSIKGLISQRSPIYTRNKHDFK